LRGFLHFFNEYFSDLESLLKFSSSVDDDALIAFVCLRLSLKRNKDSKNVQNEDHGSNVREKEAKEESEGKEKNDRKKMSRTKSLRIIRQKKDVIEKDPRGIENLDKGKREKERKDHDLAKEKEKKHDDEHSKPSSKENSEVDSDEEYPPKEKEDKEKKRKRKRKARKEDEDRDNLLEYFESGETLCLVSIAAASLFD
jgi:hypothetical protein